MLLSSFGSMDSGQSLSLPEVTLPSLKAAGALLSLLRCSASIRRWPCLSQQVAAVQGTSESTACEFPDCIFYNFLVST